MSIVDISLIIFSLLTLHYIYFVGSIFVGLIKLSKTQNRLEKKTHLNENSPKKISVIVPFRNEADVLLRNISSLEKINYPDEFFEVIYIDDNSEDNSFDLIKSYNSKRNIHVRKLETSNQSSGTKKQAVEYGINMASGEIIFATDADCEYGEEWINSMLKNFDDETGFVAGPVNFETDNSLLSRIQQLEHAGLILSGAGLIGIRNPIICSGANIAFRKDVFNKLDGYSGYLNFASGDDSFLMTKVFYDSDYKVKFCYDSNAMVKTRANKDVGEFLNQRRRWVGKAFFYKNKKILMHIVLLSLFLIGLPLQLIFGFIFNTLFLISFFVAVFLKYIVEYLVMKKGTSEVYEKRMLKWFFISELVHIPYAVVTVLLGVFSKFNWKGRDLKK